MMRPSRKPKQTFVAGATNVCLGAGGGPGLVWAQGMTRAEIRRAVRIVDEQQALLLERWRSIHG